MKKLFWVSLCYQGAHGGALYVTDEAVAFRTRKIQLPEEMKTIDIFYHEIESVNACKALFALPAIRITLKDGLEYKFITFRKNECLTLIHRKIGGQVEIQE